MKKKKQPSSKDPREDLANASNLLVVLAIIYGSLIKNGFSGGVVFKKQFFMNVNGGWGG